MKEELSKVRQDKFPKEIASMPMEEVLNKLGVICKNPKDVNLISAINSEGNVFVIIQEGWEKVNTFLEGEYYINEFGEKSIRWKAVKSVLVG